MTSYKFDVTPAQYSIAVDILRKKGFDAALTIHGRAKSIVVSDGLYCTYAIPAEELLSHESITFNEFMEQFGAPKQGTSFKPTDDKVKVAYIDSSDSEIIQHLMQKGFTVVSPSGCNTVSESDISNHHMRQEDDRPLSKREQAWLDKQQPTPEPAREANIPDLPDNDFSPRIGWLR